MVLDPIRISRKLGPAWVQKRALNTLLTIGIPFNRWLGMRVQTLETHCVEIISPPRKLRQNHLGGAHACALALLGEFPAGLLIARNYPFEKFRIIMAELSAKYEKQGRGKLLGKTLAPEKWPAFQDNEELWVDLDTTITNEKNETVATVTTKWQVKPWDLVKNKK